MPTYSLYPLSINADYYFVIFFTPPRNHVDGSRCRNTSLVLGLTNLPASLLSIIAGSLAIVIDRDVHPTSSFAIMAIWTGIVVSVYNINITFPHFMFN